MRISVIEDNPGVQAMVATALELHGHVVETYTNSSTFFSALHSIGRTPPYDLVIVDLFLEHQLGTDVVELCTTQPQAIPTILISAAEEKVFAPIRKSYPELLILRKPFRIQALVSLVNSATAG